VCRYADTHRPKWIHGRFTSCASELYASVISEDSPVDQPTPFALEVITDQEHGTAMLKCVIDGKVTFHGPFTAEPFLYAARVLHQGARNIDPVAKLVVIE
jgi:hypothetical protein